MVETAHAVVVPDLLRARASAEPDRVAVNADGRVALTFGEWERRSTSVAHGLLAAGVRRQERVGLLFGGTDWIDYAVCYLAVLKAGATAVHLNEWFGAEEIVRRGGQCGVVGVVHGASVAVPPGLGWSRTPDELDSGSAEPLRVQLGSQDIADILYTSGTTGPAKPIANPHGNPTYRSGIAGREQLDRDRPVLGLAPVSSSASVTMLTAAVLTGSSSLLFCLPEDVERAGELIAAHRVSSAMMLPWCALLMANTRVHERHDLSSLKLLAFSSAPLPPAMADRLLAACPGARIVTAYSQSEASPAVVFNVYDPARPLSVGRPAPGTELRVVAASGADAEAGQAGEIWLRSPAPKRRYLDPEYGASARVDGWVRTRDLGRLDETGELYFLDRMEDAIWRDGRPVSTIEIEAALYEHPAVLEAAVFGVGGQAEEAAINAAVVLTDPGRLDDLKAFLAGRLAAHQLPERVTAVADLPRGFTGKVLKRLLRAAPPQSGPGTEAAPGTEPAPASVSAPASEVGSEPASTTESVAARS
ncbi:MAG: acyl--CoA ligase [Catenulispora sp.]|nr:acyl--CoA ligase [Catenulispora sp.]